MKLRRRKHQIGHFAASREKFETEFAAKLWRNGGKAKHCAVERLRRENPEHVAKSELLFNALLAEVDMELAEEEALKVIIKTRRTGINKIRK